MIKLIKREEAARQKLNHKITRTLNQTSPKMTSYRKIIVILILLLLQLAIQDAVQAIQNGTVSNGADTMYSYAYSCHDSTKRFEVTDPSGQKMKKSCAWIQKKKTDRRCRFLEGATDFCPKLCTNCCQDAVGRFNLPNGKKRSCNWVNKKPKVRCKTRTSRKCPYTCGVCTRPLKFLTINDVPCSVSKPCPKCAGSCDNDSQCDRDLECFHRVGNEPIPNCVTGGSGDIIGLNYCFERPPYGQVTYIPGEISKVSAGLSLSTGLQAKIIARSGHAMPGSGNSFHYDPDAGATFPIVGGENYGG